MDLPPVLRPFIRDDGSVKAIPAKASKRRLLLEYLVAAFEPGVRMTEQEVNVILRAFYPTDWVSLRRYLIDAGLLDREDGGMYWRTGGYVDV